MRWLYIALGSLLVGIGVLGVFLPLLPHTIFFLLAAACYARGSERAHTWLMTNRFFGRYLRNYSEHRGATPGTKAVRHHRDALDRAGDLGLADPPPDRPHWIYAGDPLPGRSRRRCGVYAILAWR